MPVELKESGSAVVSPETVEAEEAGDDVEEARVHDPKNLLLDDDCYCCARVAKNWLKVEAEAPLAALVEAHAALEHAEGVAEPTAVAAVLGALVLGHAHGQVVLGFAAS